MAPNRLTTTERWKWYILIKRWQPECSRSCSVSVAMIRAPLHAEAVTKGTGDLDAKGDRGKMDDLSSTTRGIAIAVTGLLTSLSFLSVCLSFSWFPQATYWALGLHAYNWGDSDRFQSERTHIHVHNYRHCCRLTQLPRYVQLRSTFISSACCNSQTWHQVVD